MAPPHPLPRFGPRRVLVPPAPGQPWAYATLLLISLALIGFGQLPVDAEIDAGDPPVVALPTVSSPPTVWAGAPAP